MDWRRKRHHAKSCRPGRIVGRGYDCRYGAIYPKSSLLLDTQWLSCVHADGLYLSNHQHKFLFFGRRYSFHGVSLNSYPAVTSPPPPPPSRPLGPSIAYTTTPAHSSPHLRTPSMRLPHRACAVYSFAQKTSDRRGKTSWTRLKPKISPTARPAGGSLASYSRCGTSHDDGERAWIIRVGVVVARRDVRSWTAWR